ncbi:MAG: ArsA family ATPase [Candidatus Poseidoniaceae archaeon]|jgi:arsenite-transporting ATPase|tara:strand:- start:315 stop:1574 length:1260 start_codon:yes stop_codon:yes gene_type:complete
MARLLLFGGKGGVGKTTTSAATAVWLADSGLRVLLVSSDPAHSTSDSLGVEIGSEPTPIEGVDGLFGLEMDPESKISTLLPKLGEMMNNMGSGGGMGGLGSLSMMLEPNAKEEMAEMRSEVQTSDMVIPGLDEALAFDELLRHVEDPTWDVIVFDTAPTGHTLRFLSLPELIESWSDRLIRMMRVSGGIRSMIFGRKESESMKEELERFRRRVLHVRRVLSNEEITSFTLVTIPERMGINETLRAHQSLTEYKLPVPSCLVNRVTPEFDHPFLSNRREAELERIEELKGQLENVEIATMELMDTEVVGLERLRDVGIRLYGEVKILDDSLGPHPIGKVLKHSIHRGMKREIVGDVERIFLHYPGIHRDELSLRSNEGILYVGLNGREREVKTQVPTKASLVKAKLENDVLRLDIPLTEE